jgi:hypothetical protein
LNAE